MQSLYFPDIASTKISGVKAVLNTNTRYGDYQISLSGGSIDERPPSWFIFALLKVADVTESIYPSVVTPFNVSVQKLQMERLFIVCQILQVLKFLV